MIKICGENSLEAIKIINNCNEIQKVWNNNKIPLIETKNLDVKIKNKYQILEIPNEIHDIEEFTKFCHDNGLECGEYISKKKFDTSKEDCFLCRIAKYSNRGESLCEFNQNVEREDDIIIYESENFFIKIEYGCLKKGMVMICPKSHIFSAANIPEEFIEEYYQVMKDIEFLLKGIYGDSPVIFFEHGSSPNGFSSHKRSVVHAHIHVAWGVKFEKKYIDMVCLKPVKNITDFKNVKYLSYQEGTKGTLMLVNDPEVYIQRQYPRQVIAEMLKIDNKKANWRSEPFTENMKQTFDDFYNFLCRYNKYLPERINKATKGFITGYYLRNFESSKQICTNIIANIAKIQRYEINKTMLKI